MYKVYEITCKRNGKVYIGYTSLSMHERFQQHIDTAFAKHRKKFPIHFAIKKYGKENFVIRCIQDSLEKEECLKLEKDEISKVEKEKRYNIHEGGSGGDTISLHPNKAEIRKKFSDRSKLFWKNEDYKNKLSEIAKSNVKKLEALHNGSKRFWANENNKREYAEKYLIGNKNPFFEKKHSKSTRSIISKKIKSKYQDENYLLKIKKARKNRKIKRHLDKNASNITDKQYYEIVIRKINFNDSITKIAKFMNLSYKIVYNRLRWIGLA